MKLALSLSAVLHSSSALVANSEKLRANSCDRALLGPHSEAKEWDLGWVLGESLFLPLYLGSSWLLG